MIHWRRIVSLSLLPIASFTVAPAFAVEVINEDFEDQVIDGNLIGTAIIQDLADGRDNLLSLTQGANGQAGFAWLNQSFNLQDSHVEIDFDFYIRTGTSAIPADGMSVIFQFGDNTSAVGGGGGGLGTSGFPTPYVSVAFDIWDNTEGNDVIDPNIPPCYTPGSTRSCHVEVNQDINPGLSPSLQTNADLGINAPDFTAIGDQLIPIHTKIIFDNGLIEVYLQTAGDPNYTASPVKVLSVALAAFPNPADAIIGFAASTGGANAHHEVDNLIVDESASRVTYVNEPPLTTGAMNAGGPEVDATAEIGVKFAANNFFGSEAGRSGDLATGLVIKRSSFGRVGNGFDFTNANGRPIDVSKIPGAGVETAKIFVNDAWSTVGVIYQAKVVPGKYSVSLYWAENFGGAINGVGQGTKLYDVLISGTPVLCNWSAASAAGSLTGSGDPNVPCEAVLDTAIRRTFNINLADEGGGTATLLVKVNDLGFGNPPENAALNAINFVRTGGVDGNPPSGDIECLRKPAVTPTASVLLNEDFDSVDDNQCPPEMVCNGVGYTPQAVGGRLRLTEDLIGNTGSTAIFEQCADVISNSLEAEFDVFMAWEDDQVPADGGAFFVMQGTNTSALGGGGGGNGIPTDVYGFAVEFDTWDNGAEFGDTSGFNGANGWTHVGINNMSFRSLVTNTDFDPNLKPVVAGGTGWVNFRDPAGAHAKVKYNAGHVEVTIEGFTDDGTAFGPTLVAAADVPPINTTEAVVGFSGGTGGANQTLEFDNVTVKAATCKPPAPGTDPLAEALERARVRWRDRGELYINTGGPMLACSARANPATGATGDASEGDLVTWVADNVGGGAASFTGEFFSVTPLLPAANLQVAGSDMGVWDARGTSVGLNDNDQIFQSERYQAMEYDIPAPNGPYEVTLYFANSYSGTAGTARRLFHVNVDGVERDGFTHCEFSGKPPIGAKIRNPFFGFDTLYDPVDAAEELYSSDACNFAPCADNGVLTLTDPDADRITAPAECGNAAASALRYDVDVTDGSITIALTPPDTLADEPASPDGNPKISGISIRKKGPIGAVFHRGDSDDNGSMQLTDAVRILNVLFLGIGVLPCREAADADDNGSVQLTDAVRILNVLFLGVGTIPLPGPPPAACGVNPTPDGLDCLSYTHC